MAEYRIGSTQPGQLVKVKQKPPKPPKPPRPPRKPMGRKLKIALAILLTVFIVIILPVALMATYILIPLRAQPSGYDWSPDMNFNALRSAAGHDLVMPADRDMRVLMIADTHVALWSFRRTFFLMDRLVAMSDPDLIVLMGDNVGFFWNNLSMNQLIRHLDGYGIPWAMILGNHDERGKADRNYLARRLQNTENGLFLFGPNSLYNVSGNYFINLVNRNRTIVHTLYMMGVAKQYGVSQLYRAIPDEQVDWFRWAKTGNPDVDSTIMMHIPLREFHNAWEYGDRQFGYKRDSVHRPSGQRIHAPLCTANFFDAITDIGRTRNFFSGHCHLNNFSSIYQGIQMTYVMYSSHSIVSDVYWRNAITPRGGTLLTVAHDGSTRQRHLVIYPTRRTPSLPRTTKEDLAQWLNAELQ